MTAYEVNFDGLVGLTHNYGGLAVGNIAAAENALTDSNPREAALQGLAKMKYLADLGVRQGVLPPQERPTLDILRKLGFRGDDISVIGKAARAAPGLLRACCSASSMWVANAATVSPSADTEDGRVHITPANLPSQFHRSIESPITAGILRRIFREERHFAHHDFLPQNLYCADEGAANHMRLCLEHSGRGLEIFVYGRAASSELPRPARFPARQSLEACQAISRLHRIRGGKSLFLQQNPAAIDAGAFHNDVLAVTNCNVMLYHERAYLDRKDIEEKITAGCDHPVHFLRAGEADISLDEAVRTYVFNSQLISLSGGEMMILAPSECEESESVRGFLERIAGDSTNPVDRVEYVNLRQSMRNGGGPACLRLRIVLTKPEFDSVAADSNVLLDDHLHRELKAWIEKHYRDRLSPGDLADPALMHEGHAALDELTRILALGSLYEFQQV